MKRIILIVCALIPLAGCASYQGGTTEKQQEFSTQSNVGQSNPEPMSSPSFRPGMNSEDPRDPLFPTRPQPDQVPIQSPP
jgi:hypothetical protein